MRRLPLQAVADANPVEFRGVGWPGAGSGPWQATNPYREDGGRGSLRAPRPGRPVAAGQPPPRVANRPPTRVTPGLARGSPKATPWPHFFF
jgi:hypothetical protein